MALGRCPPSVEVVRNGNVASAAGGFLMAASASSRFRFLVSGNRPTVSLRPE
jgi:hypothetical protein